MAATNFIKSWELFMKKMLFIVCSSTALFLVCTPAVADLQLATAKTHGLPCRWQIGRLVFQKYFREIRGSTRCQRETRSHNHEPWRLQSHNSAHRFRRSEDDLWRIPKIEPLDFWGKSKKILLLLCAFCYGHPCKDIPQRLLPSWNYAEPARWKHRNISCHETWPVKYKKPNATMRATT